jgi:hypothetical protein
MAERINIKATPTPEELLAELKKNGITNLDQLAGVAARHFVGTGSDERWAFIVKGKFIYHDEEK